MEQRANGNDGQGEGDFVFKTHDTESFGNAKPGEAEVSGRTVRWIMESGLVERVEERQESGRRGDTADSGPQLPPQLELVGMAE